ncbi:MAG TPA: DUF4388 domain-containing protein [Pyrinomonadaceae bacterium]|jgi:hypothetical protein|nr:DUF4388 domain-containing protein [Pyrinomonadaceae bacterium]
MALTGHLSDLSLSELIEFFCNQRKTGQLKVLYPQGPGYFYLQTGSVVDARIGVLRGIDAVYYALTLPNAKFEFGSASEPTERTINQPWTQVVLEGLRRLDEGIVPTVAFPPEYHESEEAPPAKDDDVAFTELESLRVPSFLSFMSPESSGKRKFAIAGAVAFAVLASVAAIGFPAGWYNRAKASAVAEQPTAAASLAPAVPVATPATNEPAVSSDASQPGDHGDEAALALKRQREKEKEKEKAKAREDKAAAALTESATGASAPASTKAPEVAKGGQKKITVTVTYDESGRVTQASGGDASAIRIARQKRFPAGKAGSATITIPIN